MNESRQYVVQGRRDSEADRVGFMVDNMPTNKAYTYAATRAGSDHDGAILAAFRQRFKNYRDGWRGNPKRVFAERLHHESFRRAALPPLCVDIEVAACCDLVCPFCYRQAIATPDKLMSTRLFYRLIDQCAELGVPSIKLNWRGEPLLHPRLPEFIDYAKRAGIFEVIINTNAVALTRQTSEAIVAAGLDLLIYSFDGGSKETYEKMRVGRFRRNSFEAVYGNVRRFAEVRTRAQSVFPRTKIQMILTSDTSKETEDFSDLFANCVDDVSVKAYTERGGGLPDLDAESRDVLISALREHGLPEDSPHWRDMDGNIWAATGRIFCEQPNQRLMVAYDGRVSMCCYDWGSAYPVGYVDEAALARGDRDYQEVITKARVGAKGFEGLSRIEMPRRLIEPQPVVQTLREVWNGEIINAVRQRHIEGAPEEVPICRDCTFKETYQWRRVHVVGNGKP